MAQENVAAFDLQNGEATNGSSKAVSFFALKPQLVVQAPEAAEAVQFYKSAFGAEELSRSMHPKRKADQDLPLVLRAELKIGSSIFLVCDQTDESPASGKTAGSGCLFCLETDDVDGAIANAINAGAAMEGEIAESEGEGPCCGGGRVGKVKDPYGFFWLISSSGKNFVDVDA